MDERTHNLTRALRGFDSSLFVRRVPEGMLVVFRERLLHPDAPEEVLALTDNWLRSGTPVEWGALPLIAKLQSIRRSPLEALEECLRHNERVQESKERARRSEDEAFLKDWRRSFAKATDGINTSTVAKIDRRREFERKVKYGS